MKENGHVLCEHRAQTYRELKYQCRDCHMEMRLSNIAHHPNWEWKVLYSRILIHSPGNDCFLFVFRISRKSAIQMFSLPFGTIL